MKYLIDSYRLNYGDITSGQAFLSSFASGFARGLTEVGLQSGDSSIAILGGVLKWVAKGVAHMMKPQDQIDMEVEIKRCEAELRNLESGRLLNSLTLILSIIVLFYISHISPLRSLTSDLRTQLSASLSADTKQPTTAAVNVTLYPLSAPRGSAQGTSHELSSRHDLGRDLAVRVRQQNTSLDLNTSRVNDSTKVKRAEKVNRRDRAPQDNQPTYEVFDTYLDPHGETYLALNEKPFPTRLKSNRQLGQLLDGTVLHVISRRHGHKKSWLKVKVLSGQHRGQTGYVHQNWVRRK